jgi:non-heme chloroperoxidase
VPSLGQLRYLEAPASGTARDHRGAPAGTLVLLHAFPLTAEMWTSQLRLAENGWRVIAPFLAGLGADSGSQTRPSRQYASMDDLAADVIDVLDGLHVHDAVVAGLSMGGYAALAMFRLVPGYFRGLVLADTRAEADTPEGLEARRRMLSLVKEKGATGVVEDMLPKLLGKTTTRERPEIADRVRALASVNSPGSISGAITAMMNRPDSMPLLSSIHCPTLILVGEEDTLTPVELSQKMAREIAGSSLVVIPGAGHLTNLEQTDLFNTAVADFLNHRV